MSKKLYVGNLNYNTDSDTLRQAFEPFGEVVSVNIITDRATGQARGFGFVEMETNEAAEAAMSALNGSELDGRTLRVNEAQDQNRGSSRGSRQGGGGGWGR